LPLLRPIEKCLVSQDAWVVMRGYIDHVAEVGMYVRVCHK
jgi:hypothetical protein